MAGRDYFDRITLNPPFGAPGPGTVNVYATVGDPNGVIPGNVGDRAFQIGTGNVWIGAGGTVWNPASVANLQYTVGFPPAWAPPFTMPANAALDRLAAYVQAISFTLGGVPVPGFPLGPIP